MGRERPPVDVAGAQVGVVGDLKRALASALGEAASRVGLDAPGDAAE
jgi:hypothetical protein